jgi:hypothetical protein
MKNIIKKTISYKLTNFKGIDTRLIDDYYNYFLLGSNNKRDTVINRVRDYLEEYRQNNI